MSMPSSISLRSSRASSIVAGGLRAVDRLADVLHAAEHRRDRDELRVEAVGHEARERRLAGAGWAPQDHRMQAPRFERHAQRLAGAEQVLLADHLVERAR